MTHFEELLTIKEAAAILRKHPGTIRRWITSGKITAVRPGWDYLIRASEVRRLLEGGRQA